jgi:ADP-heptose:LPS heptosyltransferase
MSEAREKILCIAFKFLGDVVVAVPALRALRKSRPRADIQLLVAEDALPIVKGISWLDRVWALPRTRGQARLRDSLPIIRALRAERFDLSIDFIGNDRGAFLTLAAGAKRKIGLDAPRGVFGRKWLYHEAISEAPDDWHETRRHLHLLARLGVDQSANLDLEIHPDPAAQREAARILPYPAIIAHISTSKPLKEWPLHHWRALAQLAASEGHRVVFATGPSPREQALLAALQSQGASVDVLPQIRDLSVYLAALSRAQLLVSGDTGPMHFAAGLGIPTLSLFGASLVHQWAPVAPRARYLVAPNCHCHHTQEACTQPVHCLSQLSPQAVWSEIRSMLATPAVTSLG